MGRFNKIQRWFNRPGHVCVEFEGGETAPEKLVCWLHREGFECGELVIHFTSSGYYDPGQTWGLPENCYPPEREDERLLSFAKFDGIALPKVVADECFEFFGDLVEEADLDENYYADPD